MGFAADAFQIHAHLILEIRVWLTQSYKLPQANRSLMVLRIESSNDEHFGLELPKRETDPRRFMSLNG